MTNTKQPEALRLAEIFDGFDISLDRDAAKELRRLHSLVIEQGKQIDHLAAIAVCMHRCLESAQSSVNGALLNIKAGVRVNISAAHDVLEQSK